ncbi:MAG: hypothetical protein U0R27_04850 [Candidatus Nanopelagicales bacterium]|nr:MAG: hypothetical protein E6Q90_10895 [Actinomycetota bacterium]HNL52495.1 hypothetical protein [Actinomycetota bacterium]
MKTALAAAGAAALFALAGCSSSDSTAESPAATTPAATASPEASMIGPIMVEPSQTEVEATVGRFLNFDVGDNPGQWEISSDNEAVVTVEQGGERDGATFNPGGEAVGVGEATVTLTDTEGGDALVYTVKVTE